MTDRIMEPNLHKAKFYELPTIRLVQVKNLTQSPVQELKKESTLLERRKIKGQERCFYKNDVDSSDQKNFETRSKRLKETSRKSKEMHSESKSDSECSINTSSLTSLISSQDELDVTSPNNPLSIPKGDPISNSLLKKKFVVNLYESRQFRTTNKPSRYVSGVKRIMQKRKETGMISTSQSKNGDIHLNRMTINSSDITQLNFELQQLETDIIKFTLDSELNSDNNAKEKEINDVNTVETTKPKEVNLKVAAADDVLKGETVAQARNLEQTRIVQASKALQEIKVQKLDADWSKILFAEKILLESSEKLHLLTQESSESPTTEEQNKMPMDFEANLTLDNLQLHFTGHFPQDSVFLLTISHEQKFMSELVTINSNPLFFAFRYNFTVEKPNLLLNIKLYHLNLNTFKRLYWNTTPCSNWCLKSNESMQNDKQLLRRSSFELCAQAKLTTLQIDEPYIIMESKPEVVPNLDTQLKLRFECDFVQLVQKVRGLLDVGTLRGEAYYWETKWCVIDTDAMLVYNQPQDLEQNYCSKIDLRNIVGTIRNHIDNCCAPRSFQITTCFAKNCKSYYFKARTDTDYKHWIDGLQTIHKAMEYFKKVHNMSCN